MTTAPNALTDSINHERMPVLLSNEDHFETWLSGSRLRPSRWQRALIQHLCASCSQARRRKTCWRQSFAPGRKRQGEFSGSVIITPTRSASCIRSQLNYFPLALPFFFFLAGFFLVLVILVQVHVLHFAYMRLGISSRVAFLLLLSSLLGSYVNIPIARLPEQEILSNQEIGFFGMRTWCDSG